MSSVEVRAEAPTQEKGAAVADAAVGAVDTCGGTEAVGGTDAVGGTEAVGGTDALGGTDAVGARPKHVRGTPVRSLGMLAGSQVITWTLTAIFTLIVPRALGPSGYGVIVTVTSVSGILGLILGFGDNPLYLAREIVRRPEEASRLLGTTVVLTTAAAPLMALAAVLFAHFAHYGSEETIALYLATATAFLMLLIQIFQATFQAIEKMQYIAFSNVVYKAAQTIVAVVLVLIGLRAIAVITGTAVVVAVVVALNVMWLLRHQPIDLRTNLESVWRLMRESLVFWVGTVFGLIYLWIDTIMLSLMTDKTVVGWYGATTTLFQTMLALPMLVTTAWLPRYITAFEHSPEALRAAARRPVEMVVAVSLPLAAGTAMFSRVIVVGLYGSEFAKAAPVLVALAVCLIPMYVNMSLGQVATAQRRQRIWTLLMVLSVAVNIGLNLVLIPLTQRHLHNGAIGAGWAMVLTEAVQAAVAFALVGGGILGRASFARILGAGAAACAMLAVRYAAAPLGTAPALALGVLALLAGLLAFRAVTREELQLVGKLVVDRLRRRSRSVPSELGAV